jgi:RimJ/RimL family protein N-acetyltransferase
MSACRKLAAAAPRNAFERGQLDRIISIARPANTVSIRSMEKLGLQLEYEFESEGVPLVRYVIGRSSLGQKVIADEPSPSNVKAAQ